ncbi:MAG: iron-containing alcohol dehydrogenase [Oscillospiraceae bacterium]|nr:iron-containing alcohol dehydrogenase [Oscillospiraceae bacterium]
MRIEGFHDYLVPAVNFMGPGAVKMVGERAKMLGGTKALIVCDKVLKSIPGGAVDKVLDELKKVNLPYVIYDGVEPNPKEHNVVEGAAMYKDNKCDFMVTIGGGSSHDCGKGIGIYLNNGTDLYALAGIETLKNPLPTIIAVNTTAGTGSEVTRHCVIANSEKKIKYVIVSWRNLPTISINDSDLMIGKPQGLTAATGMDALTHAYECYVSINANPVTDAASIQGIKLVSKWLRKAVALGTNREARENMAYASMLAGMAFNNGDLGYVHAMAHQLGGTWDMPHGVANAMLLPTVEKWNMISNPEKFADTAAFMGEVVTGLSVLEQADKAIASIERLSKDVGIPVGLKGQGVTEDSIPRMAELALKDGNAFSNPRVGKVKDIEALFRAAM